jgi:peptide chain release factor 1
VTVALVTQGSDDGPERLRGPEHFRVEWFSGSGKGGQHRNKHQNSARVVHLPTGLKRESQSRSRETSLREAMEALAADLDERVRSRREGDVREAVSAQVGSGMRGDKRRTYRQQDDTVRDDLTGRTSRTGR